MRVVVFVVVVVAWQGVGLAITHMPRIVRGIDQRRIDTCESPRAT
jgi:hypothetical protein